MAILSNRVPGTGGTRGTPRTVPGALRNHALAPRVVGRLRLRSLRLRLPRHPETASCQGTMRPGVLQIMRLGKSAYSEAIPLRNVNRGCHMAALTFGSGSTHAERRIALLRTCRSGSISPNKIASGIVRHGEQSRRTLTLCKDYLQQ